MENKKVLNEIAKLYNENSYGETVYSKIGDKESAKECKGACMALSDLLSSLGYSNKEDYIMIRSERNYSKICYWTIKVL